MAKKQTNLFKKEQKQNANETSRLKRNIMQIEWNDK